jgi:UDP-N-acetylglucosamine transferase subunit ALG13
MPTVTATARAPAAPRVVVTVGTDHHPFDRLIRWINEWLEQHPEQADAFFVQSGPAAVSPVSAGDRFLDGDRLSLLLDGAELVICHGGPGTIADAWSRGLQPVVVPRLRRFGEVVDDHQVDFCAKLAGLHRVRLAQSAAELGGCLDEFAAGRRASLPDASAADVQAAVARFEVLVDGLVSRPRRRILPRRARRISAPPATDPGEPASAGTLPPGGYPGSTEYLARSPLARPRWQRRSAEQEQE